MGVLALLPDLLSLDLRLLLPDSLRRISLGQNQAGRVDEVAGAHHHGTTKEELEMMH